MRMARTSIVEKMNQVRVSKILTRFLMLLLLLSFPIDSEAQNNVDLVDEYSNQVNETNEIKNEKYQQVNTIVPELESIFRIHAEENNYPGYAYGVIVNGKTVLTGAMGVENFETESPVTTQTVFRIASLTKGFTAMAIMKLVGKDQLSLEDPVSKYIPGIKSSGFLTSDFRSIKIVNLLTMTSGLPEDNAWADQHLDMPAEEFEKLITKGFSFSSPAGTQFEYSNLSYALLGEIISVVSGQPYQQYIMDEIIEPLGMYNTYWEYTEVPEGGLANGYRWEDEQWKLEPLLHDGAFAAIGGLLTSIDDFSKYIEFQLSAWPSRSETESEPLQRALVREMWQLVNPRLISDAKDSDGESCPRMSGYGFGLAISVDCKGLKRVDHNGGLPGYGTDFRFYPEQGIGIFSFANRTYAVTNGASSKVMERIVQEIELTPRTPDVSPILHERKNQVVKLISSWDEQLESEILADNFFLDLSKYHRKKNIDKLLSSAGKIVKIGPLVPENQLRGSFTIHGELNDIEVFFSLTPENKPKIQRLNMYLKK